MIKRSDKTKLKFLFLLWLSVPFLMAFSQLSQMRAEQVARQRRALEAEQAQRDQEELLARMMQVAYGKHETRE